MKLNFLISALLLSIVMSGLCEPRITIQPADQSVSLGANVKFQVSGTSTNPPIRYQWRFNAVEVGGQTTATLILTGIQVTNAGDYDAVLTDGVGSITSRVARLEVDPTFSKITTDAIVNSGGYGFGCAWGDYDGDGFIDLFVCNNSQGNTHDFLYHNRGDGTFERVTAVPPVSVIANSTAASWADYDNDGKPDLFVTRFGDPSTDNFGRNSLYHNEGNGRFTQITNGLIVTQLLRSHAGIWADFDNDGFLDLFVVNFRNGSRPGPALDNYLYHNNGDSSFLPISFGAKPVLDGDSFDAAAADFNNDGWTDLLVVQGAGFGLEHSLLYTNQHDGTFALQTNSVVFSNRSGAAACAWGDYDNDGLPDVFVSNNPEQKAFLYHNEGNGTFTLVTNTVVGDEIASWAGCAWGDYDNDGWLDLFVARIGKYDSSGNIVALENNCLYHNRGDGTFEKVTSGSLVNEPGVSFGAAWGDYDNDGFLDLFVSNGWAATSANDFLFKNNGNSNNWINFQLEGTASNRSAIGAKVRIKATIGGKTFWQMREISGGSGHGCQNDIRAHFGLGDATNVDLVRIEWPSGIVQTMTNVAAKQWLNVKEHQESFPPPAIKALEASRAASGAVDLTVAGDAGLLYVFEASTNLANWTKLGIRKNLSGSAQFSDLGATNYSRRFYRVSIP